MKVIKRDGRIEEYNGFSNELKQIFSTAKNGNNSNKECLFEIKCRII